MSWGLVAQIKELRQAVKSLQRRGGFDYAGICQTCKSGFAVLRHNRLTGEAFVGCSGYSLGCTATVPLTNRRWS